MPVDEKATAPRTNVLARLLGDDRLSLSRPLTGREALLAFAALGLVAALAFVPHLRHGGFYSDDWSNAARALIPPGGPGFGNAISIFADVTLYRPVLVVYVPIQYAVFGLDMAAHLAWVVAIAVIVAALLYGIMRTVGVPWVHAWLIAALTLVYPWFDSTRLWVTGGQVSLAVALALAGLWVALVGLSRRSWRWHAAAAFLYLLSILTYEITLPLVAAAGVLYVIRVGWRAARCRWGIDLAVAVAAGIWVGGTTDRATSDLAGNLTHLKEIVSNGGTLLGRTLQPLGEQRTTLALCAMAALLVAGLTVYVRSPTDFSGNLSWGLRSWLLLAVAGLAVSVVGWVIFIPADPYYTPSIYGVGNRVNGVAAIGLVIVVYATLGIAGSLVGMLFPCPGRVALVTTLSLAALLGAAYLDVLRRHISIWDAAFASEQRALAGLRAQFPTLPAGTTVIVAGHAANQTFGVPIMSAKWDTRGMVKIEYHDQSLWAYPLLEGTTIVCRRNGVGLAGFSAIEKTPRYGTVRLLDLASGAWSAPRSQSACKAVANRYLPGPSYLSTSY